MSSSPTVNQSPINLSQSSAETCDLLCEFVMDEVAISTASISTAKEGVFVHSPSGLGTCKYNGDGYTCNMILISHPSSHTVESIQADGEVTAFFTTPSYDKRLCVSSLFRQNNGQTPSSKFFNSIIPYANPVSRNTNINLGGDWYLNMMVPQTGSYFTYNGSYTFDPYPNCRWVVFKSMINIDPNDFALLVKYTQPYFRTIQGLGNRQVFFNDIDKLPGAPTAHDNKLYIRLLKIGRDTGDASTKTVSAVPVKEKAAEKSGFLNSLVNTLTFQIEKNGTLMILDYCLMALAAILGIYFGMKQDYHYVGLIIAKRAQPAAVFVLNIFYYLLAKIKGITSFFAFFFTRPKQTPGEMD